MGWRGAGIIAAVTYEVQTPVYEGPFDLLLHLILREQVDLYEVNLASIVDAYLAELERMSEFDLEVATEFLLIAATLVELKTRRLLPGRDDGDIDEELLLYEERDILRHVRNVSPRLLDGLRALGGHPLVGDVRGVGLIAGVELVSDKPSKGTFDPAGSAGTLFVQRAQANGLIIRALQDTAALCPPLIISEAEIDEMLRRFRKALDETAEALAKR